MQKYSTGEKGISTKKTRRGITLEAYNYTQNRYVETGSISGATYEKGNTSILKVVHGKYNPSIALTLNELQAVVDHGVTFLRVITPAPEKATYSISLSDFEKHAENYSNAYYGEQLACPLEHFVSTTKIKKRNKVMDAPPLSQGTDYERPQAQQLPLFRPIRFDEFGNTRGGGV